MKPDHKKRLEVLQNKENIMTECLAVSYIETTPVAATWCCSISPLCLTPYDLMDCSTSGLLIHAATWMNLKISRYTE